jgi:hypothetical protein
MFEFQVTGAFFVLLFLAVLFSSKAPASSR